MWYHMNVFVKQYCCASSINLLLCFALGYYVIVYRSVGAPVNRNYVVDGMNLRDKWMLMLSMDNLLNTKLIRYDLIVFFS